MSYNFNIKGTTKNYDVLLDTTQEYGYFEHHRYGDEQGGGLWFEGKELVDSDGTFSVPLEVVKFLREQDFVVDEDFI
jgi:hypothetical protein